jgi:hypothetical protein
MVKMDNISSSGFGSFVMPLALLRKRICVCSLQPTSTKMFGTSITMLFHSTPSMTLDVKQKIK